MNWGECKVMVQTYTHRGDIDLDAAQIPACDRMSQVLDVQDNENIASAAMAASVDLPNAFEAPLAADYARMKTVRIAGKTYKPTSMLILSEWGNCAQMYAIANSKLYAGASGQLTYAYGRQVQPIADDLSTNEILTRFPRIYLYAVVIEAFIQIQDFDAAGGYVPAFGEAVDAANSLQAFSRFDSGMAVTSGFRRI